jgi:pimeloyl-[acyl-carrier protein] methyl ester esterase
MKTWLLADGRRLAYRETGCGRPLVLVHGWAMSSAVFTEALQALAGDFRVLAPDLRGHGDSDPANGCSLEDFAGDLRQWLEGLGISSLDLLGWSLGGQVALRLAPLLGKGLGRLLLVASTPCFTAGEGWPAGLPAVQVKAMSRGLKRRYRETLDDFFARQFQAGEVSSGRLEEIRTFAAPGEGSVLPTAETALAALETLQTGDLRGELCEVEAPALVLHGDEDQIIPPDAGQFLAARLPQGRFVGLAGTGHAPFLSRPEQCFNLWREFCRS